MVKYAKNAYDYSSMVTKYNYKMITLKRSQVHIFVRAVCEFKTQTEQKQLKAWDPLYTDIRGPFLK